MYRTFGADGIRSAATVGGAEEAALREEDDPLGRRTDSGLPLRTAGRLLM